MPTLVNLDGELVAPEAARVSVFDHGFLYGDSVYETVRTYAGRPFLLGQHLERLGRSARGLEIALPAAGWLAEQVERTVAAAGNEESAIRIMVTRGEGAIGLDPRLCPRPATVIVVRPLVPLAAEAYQAGVTVVVSRTIRNAPRSLSPEIKSGNFLNNILAQKEALAAGAFEALLLAGDGLVAEGAQSNLFVVRAGRVATPDTRVGCLRGITRDLVLEACARGGVPAAERDVFVTELYEADELFLTSTLKEIVPITRVGSRPIGDGRPGPVTVRVMALYRAEVERLHPGPAPPPARG